MNDQLANVRVSERSTLLSHPPANVILRAALILALSRSEKSVMFTPEELGWKGSEAALQDGLTQLLKSGYIAKSDRPGQYDLTIKCLSHFTVPRGN